MDRGELRTMGRTGALLVLVPAVVYIELSAIGPLLYAARVVEGAANHVVCGDVHVCVGSGAGRTPHRRPGAVWVFGLITMAISSQLGDFILGVADYRTLFITAGVFCLLGTVLCWTLPRSSREPHPHGESPPLLRTALQRDLWPIWAAAVAFFGCMAGLLAFMKTFVLHTGQGSVGASSPRTHCARWRCGCFWARCRTGSGRATWCCRR